MDKHFLPEWLEKYPVFGLETKLTWRLKSNKWYVHRLVSAFRRANEPARIGIILVGLTFLAIAVYVLDYLTDRHDYLMKQSYLDALLHDSGISYLQTLAAIIFLLPTVIGTEMFPRFSDKGYDVGLLNIGKSNTSVITEFALAWHLGNLPNYCALAFVYVLTYGLYGLAKADSFWSPMKIELAHPVYLFFSLVMLQVFVSVIATVIGVYLKDAFYRRLSGGMLWLLLYLVPVFYTRLAGCTMQYGSEELRLGSLRPVGLLVFNPLVQMLFANSWACDNSLFNFYTLEFEDYFLGLSVIIIQLSGIYFLTRLIGNLFLQSLKR